MAMRRRRTELALNSAAVGKLTEVMADFEIKDLRVSVEGREILKGVSLAVNKGEVHAVMGPNGSGKSTLSHTLTRHPNYKVFGGQVLFKGKDIMTLPTKQRAILDETDSGLDIDSIKFVSDAVNKMRGPELGVLIITHYTRVLKFIKPDYVHVLVNGEFVRSGGPELADWLEAKGYSEWVKEPDKAPAALEAR